MPDLASISAGLEFERHAILAGQFWRLWSGHLVHYSAQHALIDSASALVAGLISAQSFGARRLVFSLALGAPFISVGLLLAVPGCLYYRGASGIAVMLAVMAGAGLWHDARAGSARIVRTALVLLAAALAAKTGAEAGGWSLDWSDLPPAVAVAWQAHLLGAVAAIAAVAIIDATGSVVGPECRRPGTARRQTRTGCRATTASRLPWCRRASWW